MKKIQNIYLDAIYNDNKLQIGLRTQGDTVWNYDYIPVSLNKIQKNCMAIINFMNKTSRSGANPQTLLSLKAMGSQICDLLIPTDYKDFIRNTDAENLLINIDDHLVQIPWELLCVDDQFFCQRFSMGRSVKIKQKLKTSSERRFKTPINMWIICNPDIDLEKPDWEATEICKNIDKINKKYGKKIIASLDTEKTPDDVKTSIKEYDFIHYAGHGDYDSKSPGKSGWRLLDGTFMANDIEQIAGGNPMPLLVFSNACQSTRTEQWDNKTKNNQGSFGLANSFMISGVKHYIGPLWDVPDEPASNFSIQFYKYITQGYSVGNAIKNARNEMIRNNDLDVSWASYILYGDPTLCYFQTNEVNCSIDNQQKIRSHKSSNVHKKNISESPKTKYKIFSYLKWIFLILITANLIYLTHSLLSKRKIDINQEHIYKLMVFEKQNDDKIDKLIDEISSKMDKSIIEFKQNTNDEWTSKPLRISIVVGETFNYFISQGLCFDVASAIENELLKLSRVKVLDRFKLKKIMREYKLILSNLVQNNERNKPDLLPVDLFLDIRVRIIQNNSNIYKVVMRLQKALTTEIIYKYEINIDINKFIYDEQQKQLTQNLIQFIQKKYPLSGIISNIKNDIVFLNIGYDVGVRKNYFFCNEHENIIFRIQEIYKNSSNAIIEKGNVMPQVGIKLHQCFNKSKN